jgi:hypothetical protein
MPIHALVNPSVRLAIHEMRSRLPVIKEDNLALTALIRGGDSVSRDGLDVFVHVGTYAPPVFGDLGAKVAVAGMGRDAAAAKYASWARWLQFSLFFFHLIMCAAEQQFFCKFFYKDFSSSFGWWLKQN